MTEATKEKEKEIKTPKLVDPWHPTAEQLDGTTDEQRVELLEKAIDYATSDTQFAAKLKEAIRYIMLAPEHPVGNPTQTPPVTPAHTMPVPTGKK